MSKSHKTTTDKYPIPKYSKLLKNNTNNNWTEFFKNPQKRPHSAHAMSPIPLSPLSPMTPHTPNSIMALKEISSILNENWDENDVFITDGNDVTIESCPLEKCCCPPLELNEECE